MVSQILISFWKALLQVLRGDELVESQKTPLFVIPAKAGIQVFQGLLDPGFRRGDGFGDFLPAHQKKFNSQKASFCQEILFQWILIRQKKKR